MRLTLELVANAEQVIGPNKDRIISLRGYKIPAIENLGATNDLYDIIDLSDNDILKLDNFPPMTRLETLMVANNRISRLSQEVFESTPNLKSLLLTQNRVATLADVIPIFKAKNLERLSLMDNPVTTKQHYRHFIIFHMPNLRFLDFQHVKDKERVESKKLFGGDMGKLLLKQLGTKTTEEVEVAAILEGEKHEAISADVDMISSQQNEVKEKAKVSSQLIRTLTDEQVNQLQDAIAAATTLAEIQKFEEALKTGEFPEYLKQKKTDINLGNIS